MMKKISNEITCGNSDKENNCIEADCRLNIPKKSLKTFSVTFEEELNRVMAHGVLHLCGYQDKSKVDKALMRKKENAVLRKLGAK